MVTMKLCELVELLRKEPRQEAEVALHDDGNGALTLAVKYTDPRLYTSVWKTLWSNT